jgi:hypothetical protein
MGAKGHLTARIPCIGLIDEPLERPPRADHAALRRHQSLNWLVSAAHGVCELDQQRGIAVSQVEET